MRGLTHLGPQQVSGMQVSTLPTITTSQTSIDINSIMNMMIMMMIMVMIMKMMTKGMEGVA